VYPAVHRDSPARSLRTQVVAERGDDGGGRLVEAGGRRPHREPALAGGEPEVAEHRLGRHRVRRVVTGLEGERREHPGVELSGGRHVALPEGLEQALVEPAGPVGGHPHHPAGADGEQRQGQPVLAAVELEVGDGGHQLGGGPGVAGGILHPDDVGHLAVKSDEDVVRDLPAGSDRDVVQEDRKVGGIGDCVHVSLDAGLRGPAVVGADRQDPGGAGLGRRLGHLDGVRGVAAARAGQDGHRDRLGHRPPQVALLGVAERRRLAGGAGDDEAVVAVLHQPAGEAGRSVEVEPALLVERRGHGGDDAAEATWSGHGAQVTGWPGGLRGGR
jgi:hypothetical protein